MRSPFRDGAKHKTRNLEIPGFDAPGRASRDPAASPGNDEQTYCTLSATKRSSPSPFETSSSADFLPSFLSWSIRFWMSAPLETASCATSTMTSPAESRF